MRNSNQSKTHGLHKTETDRPQPKKYDRIKNSKNNIRVENHNIELEVEFQVAREDQI